MMMRFSTTLNQTPNAVGQMLSRQAELPRLPIPSLQASAQTYLASVKPLVSDKDYIHTERITQSFIQGPGIDLHARLTQFETQQKHSWLEDIWLTNAYLKWRCPIMLNVNWWCQFSDSKEYSKSELTFSNVQVARAAAFTIGLLEVNSAIQAGSLPVDMNKTKPLCMNQYTKLFGGTRIPNLTCDSLQTPWPTQSRHIIVLVRNQIFKLDVLGSNGERPSSSALFAALQNIIQQVSTTTTPAQLPVGILTAEDRDVWARERHVLESASASNKTNFNLIDSALFALALDESSFGESLEQTHLQIFHNFGQNRWFDKPITVCVLPTGRAGVNGEHSPSDAVVPGAIFNHVLNQESKFRNFNGNAIPIAPSQLLKWTVPESVRQAISKAQVSVRNAAESINSYLLHTNSTGGSDFIKQRGKMSPDSYAQLALQLAYFRDLHHVPATYESASTRAYLHGRTECVRTQSMASKAFVEAWDRQSVSSVQKLLLLREAASVHQNAMRQACLGLGCDRHFLGLKAMVDLDNGEPVPDFFSDPSFSLSQTFRLSTSNMSPGKYLYGGFGAVTANGYGINYAVDPDSFKFSVSAWTGADTNAKRMRDTLKTTLHDIYTCVNQAS